MTWVDVYSGQQMKDGSAIRAFVFQSFTEPGRWVAAVYTQSPGGPWPVTDVMMDTIEQAKDWCELYWINQDRAEDGLEPILLEAGR